MKLKFRILKIPTEDMSVISESCDNYPMLTTEGNLWFLWDLEHLIEVCQLDGAIPYILKRLT